MQPMKKPKVVIQHMLAPQIWQEYRDLMICLAESIAPFCKIVSFNNKGIFGTFLLIVLLKYSNTNVPIVNVLSVFILYL